MEKNNKTTILDDIMYNEDGTFRPFLGHHGNISGEIADYRNTYMEAEKDFFSALLSDEQIRNYIRDLLENGSTDDLFYQATVIQEALENGRLESPEEQNQMNEIMSPEEREQFHLNKLIYAEGLM